MRILILEDEPPIADYIKASTIALLRDKVKSIDVLYTLEEANDFLKTNKIDLCLLDLNLSGEDGFEILKKFTSMSFHTIIISAHTELAIKAYEYGVIDFIPKTLKIDRLKLAFDRYMGLASGTESAKYLVTRKNNKNILIPIDEVIYLKADRYLVEAHLLNEKIEIIDKPLNNLENILPQKMFRIHRSFIVNLDFIQSFEHTGHSNYELKLKSGFKLPISRSRYKLLKQKFI
ncbi:MAG: LytTR family DNA-binding domain-containing protein [bacterium]